jgi:hypothetical protein
LDIKDLKLRLNYDQNTGIFTWISSGKEAGYTDGRYRLIGFGGKRYKAHRLAWFYMTGLWPSDHIDHKNQVKLDNRFLNLRIATDSENKCNIGLTAKNKSGYKGVSWESTCNKWRAQICVNKNIKYLGVFKDKKLASEAYKSAAVKYHGEFANI